MLSLANLKLVFKISCLTLTRPVPIVFLLVATL